MATASSMARVISTEEEKAVMAVTIQLEETTR